MQQASNDCCCCSQHCYCQQGVTHQGKVTAAGGLRLQVPTKADVTHLVLYTEHNQLFLLQVQPTPTRLSSLSLSHQLQQAVTRIPAPFSSSSPEFLFGGLVWVYLGPQLLQWSICPKPEATGY